MPAATKLFTNFDKNVNILVPFSLKLAALRFFNLFFVCPKSISTPVDKKLVVILVLAEHHSKSGVLHPGHLGVVPSDHLGGSEHQLEVGALKYK